MKGEHIAMGTGTDPYQRAEGRYKLMRGIIEALIDHRNPFSILTKGTLILRDVDLMVRAVEHASASAAFSIGTLDEAVWRETKPGTPHPRARIDAIRTVTSCRTASRCTGTRTDRRRIVTRSAVRSHHWSDGPEGRSARPRRSCATANGASRSRTASRRRRNS